MAERRGRRSRAEQAVIAGGNAVVKTENGLSFVKTQNPDPFAGGVGQALVVQAPQETPGVEAEESYQVTWKRVLAHQVKDFTRPRTAIRAGTRAKK